MLSLAIPQARWLAISLHRTRPMTTVVEFRPRRSEADARLRAMPPCAPHATREAPFAGAEIILMPLAWITKIRDMSPRKPLKRRFAVRPPVLAPA